MGWQMNLLIVLIWRMLKKEILNLFYCLGIQTTEVLKMILAALTILYFPFEVYVLFLIHEILN